MRVSGLNDDPEVWASPVSGQPFVLIDLYSQGRAVAGHTRAWPAAQLLAWLRHWGTLDGWKLPGVHPTYAFRSWCGMSANFFLVDDTLTFLADHTTSVPPAPLNVPAAPSREP